MTDRPALTTDHFRDALAVTRATLHADDAGLLAIVSSADVGMTFQALVQLYIDSLAGAMHGDYNAVDAYLAHVQAHASGFTNGSWR